MLRKQQHFIRVRHFRTDGRVSGPEVVRTSVCILGGGPVGLLLSSQLSSYGVKHCIVERRETPTIHPQAHFMNARTMEILQAHLPTAFNSVLREMPSSNNWRDFVYCYSVAGRHFARVDHFKETSPLFWDETPSNVVHLPQNKFEVILREEAFKNPRNNSLAEVILGYEAKGLTYSPSGTEIALRRSSFSKEPSAGREITVQCDYLVAADGANSAVRRSLDIPLIGQDSMHTLMNVHFTCPGLLALLQPRPAMLYFAFNEGLVAVFVAHDPERDEWVCQIPIFPPFQNPEDFDEQTVQRLLRKGLGLTPSSSSSSSQQLDIKVLSVNSWTMHAQVAAAFTNKSENAFLAGDAAHRFPPAGGFGMNTGLQDAHNIAWKLALVTSGRASKGLLSTYQSERKPVADANTSLSMRNYEKSASVARMLGVDPALAKIAIDTAKASFSSLVPLSVRKVAVNSILDMGLSTLALLGRPGQVLGDVRVSLVQRIVDRKDSLPLIFPREDIDFDYAPASPPPPDPSMGRRLFGPTAAEEEFCRPLLREGGRIPHCWFFCPPLERPAPSLPLEGGDRSIGAGDSRAVVSSVSLSALLHSLTPPTSDPLSQLPQILLLVDGSNVHVWLEAAEVSGLRALRVVAVEGQRGASPAVCLYRHRAVQGSLQNPFYQVEDCPASEDHQDAKAKMLSEYLLTVDGSQDRAVDTVHDFTGRWREICGGAQDEGEGSSGYCTVAVRPDGHVTNIAAFQGSPSLKDAVRHIDGLRKSLCLL